VVRGLRGVRRGRAGGRCAGAEPASGQAGWRSARRGVAAARTWASADVGFVADTATRCAALCAAMRWRSTAVIAAAAEAGDERAGGEGRRGDGR
jgi:hypothetical protein